MKQHPCMHRLARIWTLRCLLVAAGTGLGWWLRPLVTPTAEPAAANASARPRPPAPPQNARTTTSGAGDEQPPLGPTTFDRMWKALTTDFKPGQPTGYEHPVTVDQLEPYLKLHGRDAESLVTAWQLTGDDALLAEVREKFPDDVRLLAATWNLGSEDEQAATLERWRKVDPENALVPGLLAAMAIKRGDSEKIGPLLAEAARRPHFETRESATQLSQREALMLAGKSPAEARILASTRVHAPTSSLGGITPAVSQALESMVDSQSDEAAKALALDAVGFADKMADSKSASEQGLARLLTTQALYRLPLARMHPASVEWVEAKLEEVRQQPAEGLAEPLELGRLTEAQAELYYQKMESEGTIPAMKWAAKVLGQPNAVK